MVTSSLSSAEQRKQDLLIFNQFERLKAEQPEEAHEGARQGRGLVRGGQRWGEVRASIDKEINEKGNSEPC